MNIKDAEYTDVVLTIDDETAPVIVLSHLQKCTVVKKIIINHQFNCEYELDEHSVLELGTDSQSDSGSETELDEEEEEDDVEYMIYMRDYKYIPHNECETLFKMILHVMEEYVVSTNPTAFSHPQFHGFFNYNISQIVRAHITDDLFNVSKQDDANQMFQDELSHMINTASKHFFQTYVPIRSHPESILLPPYPKTKETLGVLKPRPPPKTKDELARQIQCLREKPQPSQRTPEWYHFRNNLITASNAYKIWESEKMRNSLIYEKCCAIHADAEKRTKSSAMFSNVESPLHWGQKYEPVSVMIYEHMFNTTIEDFGCIQHNKYSFIGASPDGINVDETTARYGRMLEIKNIVNRVIDGIPKKEYWIQMQLQMEVCDLDECDFLETRFVEYESYADYMTDKIEDTEDKFKGLLLYFVDPHESGLPIYEYCPLLENMEEWEETTRTQREANGFVWIRNIYWKLEEMSCVLVCRNRIWFENCVGDIADIWKIIEDERMTGYSHREPTRRVKADGTPINSRANKNKNHNLPANTCFILVNKCD